VLAIRAMGSFDDPAVLRKAFDLALTGDLRLSELRYLFGSAAGRRAARPVLYAWEKENWSKLTARLSGSFGRGMLVSVAGGMCTRAELDDAAAFSCPALQGVEWGSATARRGARIGGDCASPSATGVRGRWRGI